MSSHRIVAVSANVGSPSRTLTLTREIVRALELSTGAEAELVEVSKLGRALGQALTREQAAAEVERALRAIESADVLVAATPVHRGSYTGHFKHLFDLIAQDALIDIPVIVAATGGSDRHCLIIEHQLRPLFAFFQAFVVPTGIYATDRDFVDGELRAEQVKQRISGAARQATRLLPQRVRASETTALLASGL
jgi:FMN reductase